MNKYRASTKNWFYQQKKLNPKKILLANPAVEQKLRINMNLADLAVEPIHNWSAKQTHLIQITQGDYLEILSKIILPFLCSVRSISICYSAFSTLPTGEVGQKYYALKKSSPFVNSRWKWTSPIENGLQKWKKWSPLPAKWSPFPAMWSPFPANWSPFPAKWSPFPAKSSPFPANKL